MTFTPVWGQEFTAAQVTDLHWGHPTFERENWEKVWPKLESSPPDILLLTGDHADNRGSRSVFFRRTHEFLADLQQRLQGRRLRVAVTLGNNDLYPNYSTDPEMLEKVLRAYRHYLGAEFYLDELGNGRHPDPPAGTAWLSLNAQLFSPKNGYSGAQEQAEQAMRWLQEELALVEQGTTVYLLSHIAPVVDLWDGDLSWQQHWVDRIREVLNASGHEVAIVSGHFHRNEISSLELDSERVVPVFVSSALCRKYDYHAAWREYRFSGDQVEFTIDYPGLDRRSQRYRLAGVFGMTPFRKFQEGLLESTEAYEEYAREVYAWNPEWRSWATDKSKRALLLDLLTGGGLGTL